MIQLKETHYFAKWLSKLKDIEKAKELMKEYRDG